MKLLLYIFALLAPAPALAADNVALASEVFVERQVTGTDGKTKVVREEPKLVMPGDKLVFELTYKNAGATPCRQLRRHQPDPASVSFVASDSPGADFSVDGGQCVGRARRAQGQGRRRHPSRRDGVRRHARPLGLRQGNPGRRHRQTQLQGHRPITRNSPFSGATERRH